MYCFQTYIFQDDEESVIENDSEYETTEEEEIVDGDEEVFPGLFQMCCFPVDKKKEMK